MQANEVPKSLVPADAFILFDINSVWFNGDLFQVTKGTT